ncbi:Tn3 family transposase [Streptomyces malaysiensis]|uniref:Tn3 family transposase n=1 Tax=Streptomyces malaysiensis TaxID=92644 RepID=UPI003D7C289D
MFVLCLRILQSALVYVNTLMLQDILGEPEWTNLLTPADRRGLTPLFWSHLRPYGEVNLDMDTRLKLTAVTVPGPRAPDSQAAQPPWKTHDLHRYSAAGSRAGVLGGVALPPIARSPYLVASPVAPDALPSSDPGQRRRFAGNTGGVRRSCWLGSGDEYSHLPYHRPRCLRRTQHRSACRTPGPRRRA